LVKVVEYDKVRDLEGFLRKLAESGYLVEYGPHAVLEDHSEISTFKVYVGNELAAYIVAHYITQYYRAFLENYEDSDEALLDKLLEIKYSGERWSIPVNPLYVIAFNECLLRVLEGYRDEYPVVDGNRLVEEYRSRNPNYRSIPRVIVARIIDSW